ncbi:MAG: 6,7-dimethyl-8-ribityllumazine synthase, partial [Alphaproteobacteria bacterium]
EKANATYERFSVPGAFELPAAIRFAIRSMDFNSVRNRFDGYVALGCVIRGETTHYDHVCTEVSRALQQLAVDYTLALGFGLLTCENRDQAMERADPARQDKGGHAVTACLAQIELKRAFRLYPR